MSSHKILTPKQFLGLRPSELVAYNNPVGFYARDFLGRCEFREWFFETFEAALEHCVKIYCAGGRPMLQATGVDNQGISCRCMIPVTSLINERLRK